MQAGTVRAIARLMTLGNARPFETNQRIRAIAVSQARPAHRRVVHDLWIHREPAIDELHRLGAGSAHAYLTQKAIALGHASIAALAVDAAHHVDRAIAVSHALLLVCELANVKRSVGRDASLAGGTISRGCALDMATLEGAHQGSVAIGVDGAPFGNGARDFVIRRS